MCGFGASYTTFADFLSTLYCGDRHDLSRNETELTTISGLEGF